MRCPLASLSIRKLNDETYDRLRVRAARHGVSIEEEVRQILTLAVAAPERLGDLFMETFGPGGEAELELSPREPHGPMDLEDDVSSEETIYLLRSPKNASRLIEAIAELERDDGTDPG